MNELNISEEQGKITSRVLLQEIERHLICDIGGESRYYEDRLSEKNSMMLVINNTKKTVNCKTVRDIIAICLPLFNLSEERKIDDIGYENIIFLEKGGDITISALNRILALQISVNGLYSRG